MPAPILPPTFPQPPPKPIPANDPNLPWQVYAEELAAVIAAQLQIEAGDGPEIDPERDDIAGDR